MLEKLSYHWGLVQGTLFPSLKAKPELSKMTRMHQRFIALVEVVRVEKFIKSFEGYVGCPESDRCAIARAFIAKTLYNVGETKSFIEFLTNDSILRRICGWENKQNIPSESTFSRAFSEFAKSELATRLHEAFVVEHHGDHLVGEISRDATAIEASEKATPKLQEDQVKKEEKKRGRPKKGTPKVEKPKTRLENQVGMNLSQMLASLPRVCDIGTKKIARGLRPAGRVINCMSIRPMETFPSAPF